MGTASERLYEEFLERYELDKRLYSHAFEIYDHQFKKLDEIKVVYFGDVMIPVSEAVHNSIAFAKELNAAPIRAEQEIKKYIGRYKGCALDFDDANLFCYTVEEMLLKELLWPFHLLTVGAELTEKDFYPIADLMAGYVCDALDALESFDLAILQSNDRIDAQRDDDIERMRRRTDYDADHAPVEIRGSIRRSGNRISVYANARSTFTEGMRTAEYQVHDLVATQNANNEKVAAHRALMNELEGKLLKITNEFSRCFYDRLRTLGDIIGKNVLRDTVCTQNANFRPHLKENAKELIRNAPYEVDFHHVATMLRFYDFSFDELFGKSLAINVFNDYVRDKKIDVEDFYYEFYCYFYEVEHAVQSSLFFYRLLGIIEDQAKKLCEKVKATKPEAYTEENRDRVLATFFRFTETVPGMSAEQSKIMMDAVFDIFYKVLGKPRNDTPVFQY